VSPTKLSRSLTTFLKARNQFCLALLAALTLLAAVGCHLQFLPVPVTLQDPKVQPLLAAIEKVDRAALGFTPIPTNARLNLEVTSGATYDAMLHIYGETSRTIAFRRTADGFRWIAEQETHEGPQWHQTVDGVFRENFVIEYQTETVNGIPTNQVCIRYTGSDRDLLDRDFTLAEVIPVLERWRTLPVEMKPAHEMVDDSDPAFLFFVLVMLCVVLAVCAAALLLCVVGLAIAAVLVALGIFSTSVVVGVLRRSVGAGFRAAFLQVGAVLGLLGGSLAVLGLSWITASPLNSPLRWSVGCLGGLAAGVALAWLFNRAWGWLAQALARKLSRSKH
jgi:hypothetical protein